MGSQSLDEWEAWVGSMSGKELGTLEGKEKAQCLQLRKQGDMPGVWCWEIGRNQCCKASETLWMYLHFALSKRNSFISLLFTVWPTSSSFNFHFKYLPACLPVCLPSRIGCALIWLPKSIHISILGLLLSHWSVSKLISPINLSRLSTRLLSDLSYFRAWCATRCIVGAQWTWLYARVDIMRG